MYTYKYILAYSIICQNVNLHTFIIEKLECVRKCFVTWFITEED